LFGFVLPSCIHSENSLIHLCDYFAEF
jgi:hypothetical protein